MFKTLVRKFKLLTVFVLIVVMITPPVTLTAQPHAIEPFYADSMHPGEKCRTSMHKNSFCKPQTRIAQ